MSTEAMTHQSSTSVPLPWYRQFWPWFVFSLPAAVVVAGITTVIIANQHADDLVARDYYKTGLAINQEIGKREHAQSLGMSVEFAFSTHAVIARVEGAEAYPQLALRLSHPLESDRDFEVLMHRGPDGTYSTRLDSTVAPRWHWILEEPGESQWRLDGVLSKVDFIAGENS